MAKRVDDKIHIWDFPKKTTVKISNDFLNEIIVKRKKLYKSWKSFYDSLDCKVSFCYFKDCFRPSFRDFRSLTILVKTCKKLNMNIVDLEKSISSYRLARSRIVIIKPKLPIKVNPIFSMLVAHGIADGCLVRFKNKSTVYLSYRQYNKKWRKGLISKAERVFGRIKYKSDYFENETRVYLPEILTLIVMDYFNLNDSSFLSKSAVIPKKIFKLGKSHLVSTLVATIVDDGHVDSGLIVIGLYNEKLIEQLARICELLDYKYTTSSRSCGRHDLYILKEGFEKFWYDYIKLKKEFPEIDMDYKERLIEQGINRMNKTWKSKGYNQTKNKIIEYLRKKARTANELAKELKVTRQGIRYHLKELEKEYIVMRDNKKKKRNNIFHLNKFVKFPESTKGQSKRIGYTNKRIKEVLNKSPMTTLKLVKKIGLKRDSLMNQLYNLERKKEIKRIGTKKCVTHPTIIWGINEHQERDYRC